MSEDKANLRSILKVVGISKSFPGVKALDNVSFDVKEGEILAILGENGAGKSTLMKILSGLYQPDSGTIAVDKSWFHTKKSNQLEVIDIPDPRYSMKLGIGMVYQHFQLVEPFTVTENITLGQEYTRGNSILLDNDTANQEIKEISTNFGLPINPEAIVENLPVGLKQRVEILKQLFRKAELLILDEPTAVLTPSESEELFKTIKELKKQGKSIIFISHKLREPIAIADRIVVLRKGQTVGEILPKDANEAILAEMVVGKRVQRQLNRHDKPPGQEILKIQNLTVKDSFTGNIVVDDVSFSVREGEILGIAGVQGNGQSEMIEAIMSLKKAEDGLISVNIKNNYVDITHLSTLDILKLGVAYIPEDRIQRGLILDFNLGENVWMGYFGQKEEVKEKYAEFYNDEKPDEEKTFLDRLKAKMTIPHNFIRNITDSIVNQYDVKTPSIDTYIRNLSGGNQQKVIVGREFTKNPNFIIASEPTRGVDIGVMTQIHKELIEQRNNGTGILLISSDLDEIIALSDTLAVMYEGKIVGIRPSDQFTIEEISQLMTVGSLEEKEVIV